jgi:NAD(P)-dependent dehydrogenase (short-subunit alcohol dehydrogenase family)
MSRDHALGDAPYPLRGKIRRGPASIRARGSRGRLVEVLTKSRGRVYSFDKVALMNKVAIVTGASSGIGAAASELLALRGFAVVLAARRVALLENLSAKIRREGGEADVVPADLSDEAQTEALFDVTMRRHGRIDVLVNNAGYAKCGPLECMRRDDYRSQFEVNVIAPFHL